MSVEWGRPAAPRPSGPSPGAPAAPPSPWEQIAEAFPAWTLEPPFTVQPHGEKRGS